VELDVAYVLAGKRSGYFPWYCRSYFAKTRLAAGEVCTLVTGPYKADNTAEFFTIHQHHLASSIKDRPDGNAAYSNE
jgi:hypothetical protein